MLTRAGCDHHMKTGATVAAFALPVRLRPVDRGSTPCPSPIAPRDFLARRADAAQKVAKDAARAERLALARAEIERTLAAARANAA